MTTATATVRVDLWESFPFTYEGREYVSKVRVGSRQLEDIVNLPAGVFSGMNAAAMRDLGISASLTREELLEELARLNAGSSWAIVELAGE
jgi:hypothetical protein